MSRWRLTRFERAASTFAGQLSGLRSQARKSAFDNYRKRGAQALQEIDTWRSRSRPAGGFNRTGRLNLLLELQATATRPARKVPSATFIQLN